MLFDKTGTLTKGKPEVTDILTLDKFQDAEKSTNRNFRNENSMDERFLLQAAASVENNSEHPLAGAIVKKPVKKDLKFLEPKILRVSVERA